jgi:eukaryotic-like serine/threonine-protein kinase
VLRLGDCRLLSKQERTRRELRDIVSESKSMPPPPRATGATSTQVLPFGRFRLIERIGTGDLGELWRAEASRPDGGKRAYAIKRILPVSGDVGKLRKMLEDEGRLSELLHHPNIVKVHELGSVDGACYLAMEYLDGSDLAALLRALSVARRRVPIAAAAFIARKVARGLAYAHALTDLAGNALGIVHRDVSPGKIMLLRTGGVKIVDFGVARVADHLRQTRTAVGQIKGRAGYMAPEQILETKVDGRADLFALGVVLWEMLTLRPLFWAPDPRQAAANLLRAPVPPPSTVRPEIPPTLDRLVLRALARSPDERFRSADDLADALEPFAGEPAQTRLEVSRLLETVGARLEHEHWSLETGPAAHLPESASMSQSPAPASGRATRPTPSRALVPVSAAASASDGDAVTDVPASSERSYFRSQTAPGWIPHATFLEERAPTEPSTRAPAPGFPLGRPSKSWPAAERLGTAEGRGAKAAALKLGAMAFLGSALGASLVVMGLHLLGSSGSPQAVPGEPSPSATPASATASPEREQNLTTPTPAPVGPAPAAFEPAPLSPEQMLGDQPSSHREAEPAPPLRESSPLKSSGPARRKPAVSRRSPVGPKPRPGANVNEIAPRRPNPFE